MGAGSGLGANMPTNLGSRFFITVTPVRSLVICLSKIVKIYFELCLLKIFCHAWLMEKVLASISSPCVLHSGLIIIAFYRLNYLRH